jgi:hypothetical protein
MGIKIKKKWTAEEKAAFRARDRSLLERFVGRDKAAETELVARLHRTGRKVALEFWPRLAKSWDEHFGELAVVLCRYRDEGLIQVDASIFRLAQQLLRQVGRRAGSEAHRDVVALRWHGPVRDSSGSWSDDDTGLRRLRLEKKATFATVAQPRFASPDAAVGGKEELRQLMAVAAKLSPAERATLEAAVAVAVGEHETLAGALGVSEAVARQRRSRMTKALRRLGRKMGALGLVERLEARRPRLRD